MGDGLDEKKIGDELHEKGVEGELPEEVDEQGLKSLEARLLEKVGGGLDEKEIVGELVKESGNDMINLFVF